MPPLTSPLSQIHSSTKTPIPTLLPRTDDTTISPTGTAIITIGLLSALAILAFLIFHNKPPFHWHLHKRKQPSPAEVSAPTTPATSPCLCHQLPSHHSQAEFVICGFRRTKPNPKSKPKPDKQTKTTPSRKTASVAASVSAESSHAMRSRRGRERSRRGLEGMPASAAVLDGQPETEREREPGLEPEPETVLVRGEEPILAGLEIVPVPVPESEAEPTLAHQGLHDQVPASLDSFEDPGYQTAEEESGGRNRREESW